MEAALMLMKTERSSALDLVRLAVGVAIVVIAVVTPHEATAGNPRLSS
jgi:hypothetical protein